MKSLRDRLVEGLSVENSVLDPDDVENLVDNVIMDICTDWLADFTN